MTKWILVENRLPEEDGLYLVYTKLSPDEDYEPLVANYDVCAGAFGEWESFYDPVTFGFIGSDFYEMDVIAWMPIPPFKEEI